MEIIKIEITINTNLGNFTYLSDTDLTFRRSNNINGRVEILENIAPSVYGDTRTQAHCF